jgi:methyl-accepting chemotaxis protein
MQKQPPITREDVQLRLPLYGIDDETYDIARRYKPLIAEKLEAEYQAYNAKLGSSSRYAATVATQGDELARVLCKHILTLIGEPMGESYLASLVETARFEHNTVFGSRAHTVLMMLAARIILPEIGKRHRFSGPAAAREAVKLFELLFLDLNFSIGGVQQLRIDESEERRRVLEGEMAEFQRSMAETGQGLARVAERVKVASVALSGAMETTHGTLSDVDAAWSALQQLVSESTAATSELNATASTINDLAERGARLGAATAATARETRDIADGFRERIAGIATIVGTINGIAAQTMPVAASRSSQGK